MGREVHRTLTRLLSVALIAIGLVLLAQTVASGGGALSRGVILGVLFVAAGVGRLALTRRAG